MEKGSFRETKIKLNDEKDAMERRCCSWEILI